MTHAVTQRGYSSPSQPISVVVDRLGGGVLREVPGQSLTVTTNDLRHLDVVGCPELTNLDLSQCQPGCHITLRDCPALLTLHLPHGGTGAVIHLDAGSSMPVLHVTGRVAHFDACWASGQCAASSVGKPWKGLWVSYSLKAVDPDHAAFASECWVMLSPAMPHGVVDVPHLRHLSISGGKTLNALSVVTLHRRTPQIDIQGLPELITMDIHAPGGICRVRSCRSLTLLSGQVTHLHLTEVAERSASLEVDVATDSLTLCHAGLTALTMTQPTTLSLVHNPRLETTCLPPATRVQCEGAVPTCLLGVATVVVDEAMVTSLINAYPSDPEGIMAKLAVLLPSLAAPADCLKALQLLDRLASLGAPLEQVWGIRMALSAHHLHPPRKAHHRQINTRALAFGQWAWQLPRDLCHEGWLADYRLWVRCAAAVSDAFHYRRAMIRACRQAPDGLAMRTAIHAMARDDGSVSLQERELWRELLQALVNKEALSLRSWDRHARRLVARYGRDPELDRLYLEVCDAQLRLGALLKVLRYLVKRHPAARVYLLRIAQRPRRWRLERCEDHREAEAYRAKAMTLAISQAT